MMKTQTNAIALLAFRLEQQLYALPITQVIEVAAMVSLSQLPDADPIVLGLANRHGDVLPVLDLKRAFGYPPAAIDTTTLFIVAEAAPHSVGLVVDEVLQVRYYTPDVLKSAQASERFIMQIARDDQRLLQVINLPAVLDTYLLTQERTSRNKGR